MDAGMRRRLVAGNWKMHGSRAENSKLVTAILEAADGADADVAVCPPFVYLWEIARQLKGSPIAVGAQNVCADAQGAFTGEVSAAMLKDVGCTLVIVGHSERRHLFGENDALIARKFVAAQAAGLTPILCVGETLEERERSATQDVVARQLDAVIEVTGAGTFERAVIAYEPVWAIGTGKTATPDQAQEVHALIRRRVGARDARIAAVLRVLYGGSVKAANAAELFAMPDVDGGLVGGASRKAEGFLGNCPAA